MTKRKYKTYTQVQQVINPYVSGMLSYMCKLFDLEPQSINIRYSSDNADFTESQYVRYNVSNDCFLINDNLLSLDYRQVLPHVIFWLAHELMTKWQIDNHEEPDELKANAFAIVITLDMFSVHWDWLELIEKISNRELLKEVAQVSKWIQSR